MNPFTVLTSKIFGAVSIALLFALAACWIGWGRLEKKYDALTAQTGAVLAALRIASDNPDLRMKEAPGQAIALGESNRRLKQSIADQNMALDQMAAEAVRLKARASELRKIADRAQAQRKAALARLSDLAATPGTREDCMTLLHEADDALNIVYEAGL